MKHLNTLPKIIDDSRILFILDTSRDEVLYKKLKAANVGKVCLFKNAEEEHLDRVAPYLIEVGRDDPFLEWILENGFGESWGVFLTSDADIRTLRNHCGNLIKARDPEGKEYFFRYYDPRILRVYFPVCTPQEKDYFLGPIESFVAEAPERQGWAIFAREASLCFGI